jgi:hypothetical protein
VVIRWKLIQLSYFILSYLISFIRQWAFIASRLPLYLTLEHCISSFSILIVVLRSFRVALILDFTGVSFTVPLCIATYVLSNPVDLPLVIYWTLINLSYHLISFIRQWAFIASRLPLYLTLEHCISSFSILIVVLRSFRVALILDFTGVSFTVPLCIATYVLSNPVDLPLVIYWTLINLSYHLISFIRQWAFIASRLPLYLTLEHCISSFSILIVVLRSFRVALILDFTGVSFTVPLCIATYVLSNPVDLPLVIYWTLINLSYLI